MITFIISGRDCVAKKMRALIHIQHPAHFHFFKNLVLELEKRGDDVIVTAKEKEIVADLLKSSNFNYILIGKFKNNLFSKFMGMVELDLKLLRIAKKFNPDVLLGIHDENIAQVGFLIRKPSIVFVDTEDVKLGNLATFPFATVICTPSCYLKNLGRKQVRYRGYHELAYLHPNYFRPNPEILEILDTSDRIIIVRFIAWKATHDIGLKGISNEMELIRRLEKYGRVFISSERRLSEKLEKYRLPIPKEEIHSLLYYADLYIGEGGTMAVEAAILGTPAIHIESTSNGIATGELCGNFLELRDKYDLLYFYPNQDRALEKAMEILENDKSKREWRKKREKLLRDKIDVTAWMVDFIKRYQ